MLKRAVVVTILGILPALPANAQLRVNRKSNHIGKFLVISKLVKLSSSNSEKVAVDALNRLREVLFRSENLLVFENETRPSIPAFVDRMNNDVDKIFQAIYNLEISIQAANLDHPQEKETLSAIKAMIIDEIKTVLGSNVFLTTHEKLAAMIENTRKFIDAGKDNDSNRRLKNLNVIANIQKVLDLAWYIYTEQCQWLMSTAYRLECLNFSQLDMKSELALNPRLNISSPPRMFVPGLPEDYELIDPQP